MARFIGLDIGARYVRAALLSTGYRRLTVERLEEVALTDPENLSAAITTAASHLLMHTEGICAAIDGDLAFVHRITLPPTAAKQLAELYMCTAQFLSSSIVHCTISHATESFLLTPP